MSILDKICKLLTEQGKKQKDLTDYLGISIILFTDWKSGRVKSYTKHLDKISEFLNVSVDYLLGKTEIKNPPTSDTETWTVHNFEGNGTHTTTVNPENLNSLKKLLDTAGELTPEKIEALIKVAENMK